MIANGAARGRPPGRSATGLLLLGAERGIVREHARVDLRRPRVVGRRSRSADCRAPDRARRGEPDDEPGEHTEHDPRQPASTEVGAHPEPDGSHAALPYSTVAAATGASTASVVLDATVAHAHDALRGVGDRLVVGHEQDRLTLRVQTPEQLEDLEAALRVERAGRLVGEEQRRLVRERPGDREPLTLAARQRVGRLVGLVADPEQVEQVAGPRLGRAAASCPRSARA